MSTKDRWIISWVALLLLGWVVRAQSTAPPRLSGLGGAGTVEIGQRVSMAPFFNVTIIPAGLSYQWRKNGTDLSGATSSNYVIEIVTAADAGTYAVTVSNDAGASVASAELIVRPLAAITFTTAPRSASVQVGQSVSFFIAVTGTYPRTFQWRKDGTDIPGATGTALTLSVVSLADAGSYSVVGTNPVGSTTSPSASLTVSAATPIVFYSASPADTAIVQGGAGALSAGLISGSSPVSYQWLKNGTLIAGATGQQLSFAVIALGDAGKYAVVASNPAGLVTSREATLTVTPATPVSFSTQPIAQSVFQGQSANFGFNLAAGSAPMTFQWLRNGAAIAGSTNASLLLPVVALVDAGSYAVVVTNAAGSITSAGATLTVSPAVPPAITRQPTGKTVAYAESFTLNATVTGTPPLTYEWRQGNTLVDSGRADFGVSSANPNHAGVYTLTVTNVAGAVTSSPATITVTPPALPVITKDPVAVQVAAGLDAYFRVEFTAVGTGGVSLRWLKDGVTIPGADSGSPFGARQDLGIYKVTAADAGEYSVVLTSFAGSVTSKPARLTVLAPVPPAINYWPSDQLVYLGQNTQLNVRANAGSPPFATQWFKSGQPLAGATSETLYLNALKESDLGLYSVTITNAGGIIASPDFSLRLYASQTSPWLSAEQLDNTVYLLATAPNRIDRYDIAGERWLPTTLLTDPRVPTALLPAPEGVYLAYGRSLLRRSLDLATETPVLNAVSDIVALFISGQYLYYTAYSGSTNSTVYATTSVHRSTLAPGPGTAIPVHSAAIAPGRQLALGLASGGTTPRLFPIDAEGRLGSPRFNFTLDQFPLGARAILFPGEDFVTNSAGTIFRLIDFSVAGSLGEPPDDIVFPGNGPPVVLRGRILQKIHSSTFFETGRAAVPFWGRRAFATGTHVFVFGAPATASATVFQVAKIAVAALTKPVPTEPTIASDEPISIDDAYLGDDGVVHVLSRSKRALLRWSAVSRTFLPPVALRAAPQVATQTAPARRAVFSYSDGVITEVPLRASTAAEGQINTVGNPILGLTDLGSMIMVNASTSSYLSRDLRLVVDTQGGFLAFTAKNDADRRLGAGWEPARRRYYSGPAGIYDGSALSYETLLASGGINGASASIENVAAPLRFSADAAFIATGNGRILNADLAPIGVLANDILDAAWLPGDVYSLRLLNGETQVQRWTRSSYVQVGALVLPGTPVRIFRLSDTQLVVITNLRGLARFSVVDANLSTDAAATSFAGVYLSRGDAKGDLALYVRRDNTAVLLLRTANPAVTIAETNLTLTASGSFTATGRDATGALHPLAGAIATDGTCSVSVPDLALTLSGAKTIGSLAAAGFYPAPAVNGANGFAYFIVGSDARALLLVRSSTTADGGSATLDPSGKLALATTSGARLAATIDANGSLFASAEAGSFTPTLFAGLREGVTPTDRLANISTRGRAGTGDDVMIAGFVLSGTLARPVLIRAIGPALGGFGVPGALADPRLALYRGETKLLENDNWSASSTADEVAATASRVGGFPLTPGSADAALLVTLDPGAYSAQVSSAGDTSGTALVEVYDAGLPVTTANPPRLVNIATRGRIATAGDTLIAGIVITGNAPKQILIRAIGPGLAAFGVPGTLVDPILFLSGTLPNSGATTLATNDDWSSPAAGGATASAIAAASAAAGAFALPPGSKDSCIFLILQPGNYTAQILGKNNTTGVALVEVYEVKN